MHKTTLLAAAAAFALTASAAAAGPYEPYGSNPNHYYSQNDHDGYYDRNGRYHRFADDAGPYRSSAYDAPPPRGGYYYDADRDPDCRRSGSAAGTVAGAVGGGLIGGVASHGNGLAIAGGAILGGLVGNALTSEVDCNDRRYAYDSYYRGLNGNIGVRVDWRNDAYGDYGYFTPIREYNRGGFVCRDFRTTTFRHGREVTREGRACRRTDGQWYFD